MLWTSDSVVLTEGRVYGPRFIVDTNYPGSSTSRCTTESIMRCHAGHTQDENSCELAVAVRNPTLGSSGDDTLTFGHVSVGDVASVTGKLEDCRQTDLHLGSARSSDHVDVVRVAGNGDAHEPLGRTQEFGQVWVLVSLGWLQTLTQ